MNATELRVFVVIRKHPDLNSDEQCKHVESRACTDTVSTVQSRVESTLTRLFKELRAASQEVSKDHIPSRLVRTLLWMAAIDNLLHCQ